MSISPFYTRNSAATPLDLDLPNVEIANIRAILPGKSPRKTYKAKTGNPMMAVSLGSLAGVAFVPPIGTIRFAWLNRKVKAETIAHSDVPQETRPGA